jgi:hypothetical protein
MSVIEQVQNLLRCVNHCGEGDAYLTETDTMAKLNKVRVTGLTSKVLVLHIDSCRKIGRGRTRLDCMSPLFRTANTGDHNRSCDFVLLEEADGGKCNLYYVEMKSTDSSGYSRQFKSTQCFLRYVREVLERLYEIKMEIGEERFILLKVKEKPGFPKKPFQHRRERSSDANAPESPYTHLLHNEEEIRYAKLIRNPSS